MTKKYLRQREAHGRLGVDFETSGEELEGEALILLRDMISCSEDRFVGDGDVMDMKDEGGEGDTVGGMEEECRRRWRECL